MERQLSRRGVLAAGAAALLLPLSGPLPAAARSSSVFPAVGSLSFAVWRGQERIGRQRFDFTDGSGHFTARYSSEFSFPLRGGRLWSYRNYGEEVWRDGWLDSLVTDTERDGRKSKLRLQREGQGLSGKVNNLQVSVSGYVVTTSLWHRDTPYTQVLLGHEDGITKVVNVAPLGRETVVTPDGAVTARRFALSGEIARNLWYAPGARLVKASWPGPEGEIVTLRLETEKAE